MISLLSILALGLVLGMRHATDPDHVIAVTTIVTRERNIGRSSIIGMLWGIGHTVTILLVGGAIIVFGLVIPPRLGLAMEFSVAVMLIFLGVINLRGFREDVQAMLSGTAGGIHSRYHSHGDTIHRRAHGSMQHGHSEENIPQGWLDRRFGRLGIYQAMRPVVVGIVHGMAGSAAVALLILASIRNPVWAMGYLLVFGMGTIAGMMLITTAIATPSAYGSRRFSRLNRYLVLASGLVSFGFGLFLAYHVGFIGGLFSAHPSWTPQ
jgi:high-affinity nickel permease